MAVVEQLPGALWIDPDPPAGVGSLWGSGPDPGPPTVAAYASGLSRALGSLTPDVKDSLAVTNPDVAVSIDAMSTIVESVTGSPLGSPLVLDTAKKMATVMVKVVEGTADVATSVGAVAKVVKNLGPIIPVLGEMAVIFAGAATAPAVSPIERQYLNQRWLEICNGYIEPPVGTGGHGRIEPADLFRDSDYRARMLMWLAGAASPIASQRHAYHAWAAKARSAHGFRGIPVHVQRQMVALMNGIYAARRPRKRRLGDPIVGDNGRALMPILMQVAADQGSGAQPAFNRASLQSLANALIAPGQQICVAADYPKTGSTCDDYPPCGGGAGGWGYTARGKRVNSGVRLGDSFYDWLVGWDVAVRDPSFRRKAEEALAARVGSQPKSRLVLSGPSTRNLLSRVAGTLDVRRQAIAAQHDRPWGWGVAGFAAGAGLAVGGWLLYQRARA